jgi:PAN domain
MEQDVDFEREKWREELILRQRELSLKERDQANRDAEVEFKRKELNSSKWRSPLVVAIFAAAAAALGNAGVTLVNGVLQRDLENTKSDAELRIEESKAESGRILEMIKTQDTEQAANNLRFLLDTALVVDPKRAEKLRAYLLTRPTPLLPPALQGPPRALEPFNVRENRDLAGQDLQNFPGSDINNCASECDGNSSCAAFAYDHFSRRCFLKSSVAGSLLRPGSTIGIKKPASIPP